MVLHPKAFAPTGPITKAQPFQPCIGSAPKIADSKLAVVDGFWQIYVSLGTMGLRFSPLVLSQPLSARDSFVASFIQLPRSLLCGSIAALGLDGAVLPTRLYHRPSCIASLRSRSLMHSFKTNLCGAPQRPGACSKVVRACKGMWVFFVRLQDLFIAAWNKIAVGLTAEQVSSLRISSLFCLCRLATQSSARLAAFRGFCPAASCSLPSFCTFAAIPWPCAWLPLP